MAGSASSTCSTSLGYTFTPRITSMSSRRPVTLLILTRVRPHGQVPRRSAAMSPVRYRSSGSASLVTVVNRLAGRRADRLDHEMVLVDVQPVGGHRALRRDARPDDLGQPVEVQRAQAEQLLNPGPQGVGPRL